MRATGFTLVELVLVIVLLGTVTAVALPRFFKSTDFTDSFARADFISATAWARNRAVTSQCAHELRIDSDGWRILRDDDRDSDYTDADCDSASNAGTGCNAANNEFFSFIYRTAADVVTDSVNEPLSGDAISAEAVERLIFTANGQLYRLTALPNNLTTGCTALASSNLVTNNSTIALANGINLSVDGATAYVAIP